MKLEEVLPALREGHKIRRLGWISYCYLKMRNGDVVDWRDNYREICSLDALKEDWEVVHKPKIKRYQVIYTHLLGDRFYMTSPDDKYTREEFLDKFRPPNRYFNSLLMASEEEFDE